MADQKVSQLTNYTPAVDTDVLPIVDTTTATTKKITWANIKATLKTYFDTLYPSGSGTSTGTNTGDNAANSNYASDYRPGGTDVAIADGGTGASTALAAMTALAFQSRARAYLNTTNQSIPASTFPYTVIIFNTESWDTLGEYSTSTGKFIPTSAGKYQINASLYIAGIAAGKRFSIAIMVNGNRVSTFDNFYTLTGGDNQIIISDIIDLAINDEVTIGAYQTDTVARDVVAQSISTFLSIHRLS